MVNSLSLSSKLIAFAGQSFSQTLHLPLVRKMQWVGSMAYFRGTAWAYLTWIDFLLASPASYSLSIFVGHFSAQRPQAMHFAMSTYRGCCTTLTSKFPASPEMLFTSERVKSSMLRCRPTSTSLGERIHIAQSLVGKVLSNWDMTPPIEEDLSTR